MTGIVVEGLSKTYKKGRIKALDEVSLEIRPGEVFGVIGPNGAGKTTLMGCLLGLLIPDAGRIAIDGLAPDDLRFKAVAGYLPERLAFDRWMSGWGYLCYHHALAGRHAAEREGDLRDLWDCVALPEDARMLRISKYSRGMLQRLGVAQALIGAPRVLFLDEPTSGMDPVGATRVREIVRELSRNGVTVVINSHQLEQMERLCDRVALVREGRVASVEVMTAGTGSARTLRIVLAGAPLESSDATSRFAAALGGVGATISASTAGSVDCEIRDDAHAAAVIAAVVGAGFPVVEATPREGRLERLFK